MTTWCLLSALAWPWGDVAGQAISTVDEAQIRAVMPEAQRFDGPSGTPPVIAAYATGEDGAEHLIGYVFHTSDFPPEQIGYNGAIETVVGMRLDGTITGARVLYYEESYMRQMGDFLRRPGVQQQFAGKFIGDPFRIWGDVDGISRVTLSMRALSRGIRDSARQVAGAYVAAADGETAEGGEVDIVGRSWFELGEAGVIERLSVSEPGQGSAGISLAYIGSDEAGEYFLGRRLYERATRSMRRRAEVRHLMLYAVEGPRLRLFVPEGWSIVQDGDTTPIEPADFMSLALLPTEGLVVDEASMVGVIMVTRDLDLRRPFTFVYDLGPSLGVHALEYTLPDAGRGVALPAGGPPEPDSSDTGDPDTVALRSGTSIEVPPGAGSVGRTPTVSDTGDLPETKPRSAVVVVSEAEADLRLDVDPDTESPTDSSLVARPDAGSGADVDIDSDRMLVGPLAADSAAAPAVQDVLRDLDFTVVTEETLLERTLAETSWGRVGRMLLVLLLAAWAFRVKTTFSRWTALAATTVFLGVVDGSFLSVSHITAGIWAGPGVYLRDLPLLIILVFTVLSTLIWGRLFCGLLCPFGALQDLIDRIVPQRFRITLSRRVHGPALWLKYGILGAIVIPALAGSHVSLYQYVEPFGTVFFRSPSLLFWAIAVAFLAASAVVPRFYCRYVCPLGAALAIGSLLSLRRIERVEQCEHCVVCEAACPTGAISRADVDFKECVRCNACEILLRDQGGVCRHDMETIRPRLVQLQTNATSETRVG